MAGDDTAALVVALSAQLSKFERDMKRANDIADNTASGIEKRFAQMNPFAGTFLGNFAADFASKGLDKAIDLIKDLTKRFTELDATAKLVGVSMNDIFGMQEAASKSGTPVDDVTASVRNLATLLDQVQRGEKNSLSDLFTANPQALQGVNVQALNLQKTFALVADLVQNARTEIQKIDLAKAAGQTESMVRFLEQGGEAVTYLSKNAAATAPDLQKLADSAKAFDDAWKKAVENVKAYLSEHLFDFLKTDLQDIISLLQGAIRFLGLFKGGLIDSSTQSAAADLTKMRDALLAFQKAHDQIDESAGLDTSATARNDRRVGAVAGPRQAGTSTRAPDRALSNVPLKTSGADDTNAFQRAEDQLEKHIAQLQAEANAQGLGARAMAEYRTEAQLTTAALQSKLDPASAAVAEKIKTLSQQAGAAAEALERARLAADISRGKQTALLSPEDVQIANQLKDVYPDVATALNSVEASALRTNQSLRDVAGEVSNDLTSGLTDIVSGAKSTDDAFSDMSKSIIRSIEQVIVKLLIVGPLMRSLQTGFNTLGIGSLFGGSSSSLPLPGQGDFIGPIAHADGGVIRGGGTGTSDSIPAMLSNGEFVVNADAASKHRDVLEAINSGRAFANGGYVADMPAVPPVAVRAGAGNSGNITINNYTDAQPSVQRGLNGDVSITIKRMVDQAVGDSLTSGTGRRVLGSSYGVKPFTGR